MKILRSVLPAYFIIMLHLIPISQAWSQPPATRMIFAGFYLADGITPIDVDLSGSAGYFVLGGDTIIPTAVVRNFTAFPETVTVDCRILHMFTTEVYYDSVQVIVPPSSDATLRLPPWVVPTTLLSAIDASAPDMFGSLYRKNGGDPLQPRPIRKGQCGFSLMQVLDQGNGSFRISKTIINKKAGPCPWSITFYYDKSGVNAGTRFPIDSASGSTPASDPPTEISTKWTPPGPGTYCVFAVTTVQGFKALENVNNIKVRNPPPPPPIPPPPPPPPLPPGWLPLPPGAWWYLPIPLLPDSVMACPDSIPIELVALQLAGTPLPFVPPATPAYIKCSGTNYGYLSVYVPSTMDAPDSAIFTVIAKVPGPGGPEIGNLSFIISPEIPIPLSSLGGLKFSDANSNGVRDSGEVKLPGWTIVLSGAASETTTTDVDGRFLFDSLAPGTYCVHEIGQPGWVQTLPDSNYCITLTGGEIIDTLDFANHNTGVSVGGEGELPTRFALHQNYPNPFNPTTTIRFDLPEAAIVSLSVYDMLGREIATPLSREMVGAGTNEVSFSATGLSSGSYIYRLTAVSTKTSKIFNDVKVMLLLR